LDGVSFAALNRAQRLKGTDGIYAVAATTAR